LFESLCNEANKAIYIKGCLDLLKNESKVISATNYLDLSKSIMDLALGLTTQGQLFVQKNLIENHHPTQAIKQCINEFYNQTINSLRSSLDELVKNPEGANKDAKLAGNGPENCEQALKAEKSKKDYGIMAYLNKEVTLICEISFLATKHLTHKVVEAYEINNRKFLAF
jgi:hypothetical protein